ncbi:MAG: hypothetical protein K8T25_24425 [Planctomycetia bacterium]|nr:hypothetical protein [Planctomycetia bacterium]
MLRVFAKASPPLAANMLPRWVAMLAIGICWLSGCGTTQWSDTKRTATEQLLISDAVDRAVSKIDFHPLAGQIVYLDREPLKDTVDENYTVSVLRQHMLASGCILKDKKDDATYVVEVRAGAVGTSRHSLLVGIPSTDLPVVSPVPGAPTRIPEIPIAKKTDQQGVAKISLFAYHRATGIPLWQSGNSRVSSTAKDTWVLGIGPFQQGTIHSSTGFAGGEFRINPLAKGDKTPPDKIWVAQGIQFNSPESIAMQEKKENQTRLAQKQTRPADKLEAGKPEASKSGASKSEAAKEVTATGTPASAPKAAAPAATPRGTIQGVQPLPPTSDNRYPEWEGRF